MTESTQGSKSRMFPFITHTWNPVGGECQIKCSYCWARKLIARYKMKKYVGEARLFPQELRKVFHQNDFVFVSDMRDLFEPNVPSILIQKVLEFLKKSPATFLLLTKNPRRYLEFWPLPINCVVGATIETDLGLRDDRFYSMTELEHPRKMVAIEPIMKFSPNFIRRLLVIGPEFVAVGYDNYGNGPDEPSLEITKILISGLEAYGIKVFRKTLREANTQCTSCSENREGFCKHYQRKVPVCGPYPNWEYCTQLAYRDVIPMTVKT